MSSKAENIDTFKDWDSQPIDDERQEFANMLAMRTDNGNNVDNRDTSMEAREILLEDRAVSGENVVPIPIVISGSGGVGGGADAAVVGSANRRRFRFNFRYSILNNPILFGLFVLLIGFAIGAIMFTIIHHKHQTHGEYYTYIY